MKESHTLPDAVRPFEHLRTVEYPWTDESTYLDNASIGPLPERTRRVVCAFAERRAAPHRLRESDLDGALRSAREQVAQLLGAGPSEIALATNTSYGIHLAARGLPLAAGEIVLVPDGEFPANVYPWLSLAGRGIRTEIVPGTPAGWPDEDRLLERLEDPRVRVLAISFVQFATGYRADLERLGAACRAREVYLVVDAIQGIGHLPLDVGKTPVDVLACGAQKWLLSPWGSGFVYVRRGLLGELEPPFPGWMAFEGTDDFTNLTGYGRTYRGDARRYELVTLPFQEMAAMAESIGLLRELDVARIEAHLRDVREPLLQAAAAGEWAVVSPTDGRHESGIVCVRPPRPEASYRTLVRAGVVCSLREGSLRFSPHWYNTRGEMEEVAALLGGSA